MPFDDPFAPLDDNDWDARVILLDTHALIWWANGDRLLLSANAPAASFHADPADRFLVAQARALGIPLLSADCKIRSYVHSRSLW